MERNQLVLVLSGPNGDGYLQQIVPGEGDEMLFHQTEPFKVNMKLRQGKNRPYCSEHGTSTIYTIEIQGFPDGCPPIQTIASKEIDVGELVHKAVQSNRRYDFLRMKLGRALSATMMFVLKVRGKNYLQPFPSSHTKYALRNGLSETMCTYTAFAKAKETENAYDRSESTAAVSTEDSSATSRANYRQEEEYLVGLKEQLQIDLHVLRIREAALVSDTKHHGSSLKIMKQSFQNNVIAESQRKAHVLDEEKVACRAAAHRLLASQLNLQRLKNERELAIFKERVETYKKDLSAALTNTLEAVITRTNPKAHEADNSDANEFRNHDMVKDALQHHTARVKDLSRTITAFSRKRPSKYTHRSTITAVHSHATAWRTRDDVKPH